jgi:3-phytase
MPTPPAPETVGNFPAGVNKVDDQTGTVYVVSVSGPKMYKLQRQPFMPRQAENTQLYQIIQIDGGTLRYEARTAVGEIYDAFTLVKRPGEINELIEQIPDTPVRIASEETPPIDSMHVARASVHNETANDQDDMCVWVRREEPADSLIIASDKGANAVFVYDLEGTLRQTLPVDKPGNIDIRQDLLINGRRRDLAVVNQRGGETQLRAFEIDRDARKLVALKGTLLTEDNYGGCLYWNEKSKSLFFATTSELGTVRLYQLLADDQDVWTTKLTRTWNIGKCEGAVADDVAGAIYVAEERRGLWMFAPDSSLEKPGRLVAQVGEHGIRGDLEGLALVETRSGRSLLIASDQGSSRFVVFDRQHNHRYCGSFRIEGAEDSDGIAVAAAPLGSRFPAGIFCCHTDVAPRPILLTAWEEIEQALFPSR